MKPNKMGMSDRELMESRASRFSRRPIADPFMDEILEAVASGRITKEEGLRRINERSEPCGSGS
jgi:hypothetical protein